MGGCTSRPAGIDIRAEVIPASPTKAENVDVPENNDGGAVEKEVPVVDVAEAKPDPEAKSANVELLPPPEEKVVMTEEKKVEATEVNPHTAETGEKSAEPSSDKDKTVAPPPTI